jgi:hypothetical protein
VVSMVMLTRAFEARLMCLEQQINSAGIKAVNELQLISS